MHNGIISVLKPPGMTSHDVVSFIRRVYGIKRVGHAGTLDPAAAGVLPVALGQATRLLEYMTNCTKSYRAELTIGYATDTGDDTGKVISVKKCHMAQRQTIDEVLNSFLGKSEQLPPMYSAIKVGGKKMCDLARQGIHMELKPREVIIHKIALIDVLESTILFDVTCSKGTYIRSLCMDIGKKLDCPVVMSFLVRTAVGGFFLKEASSLEEIADNPQKVLLSPEFAIGYLPQIVLTPENTGYFTNGRKLIIDNLAISGLVRIYSHDGSFIGIGNKEQRYVSPVKVFHGDK